ncbi:MAG: histidine kinase [Frankiales bacterium]|nr:histidine kinase [Frankiales bacterium]
MAPAPFIPHQPTELVARTRSEVLRVCLIQVLQRMVDAHDLVSVELDCPLLAGGPVTVVRARRPATSTLAVKSCPVPRSAHLPHGSLWVSASTEQALDQARSWPDMLGLLLDTELARQAAEIAAQGALEMANRDPATGLGNRRAWEHTLRTETVRSHRSASPLTLMVIDIDGLKAVNDARGHAMGDALIARTAEALANLRRATDEVCRLGGDEFGLTAPDTDAAQARVLAVRVRQALQDAGVRASLGVAVGRNSFDGHELWQQADAAMYDDKRSRRPSWEAALITAGSVGRMPRP